MNRRILAISGFLVVHALIAAEQPAWTIDVVLDRFSVQRQAQILPAERGSLQIQLTNHGMTAVTVDLSALGDRRTEAVGMEQLEPQESRLGGDPERMHIHLVATVLGDETMGAANDPWGDHHVRECRVPPGETVLASVPIPFGLVWPGERATVVVAFTGTAGTFSAPAFAIERDAQ